MCDPLGKNILLRIWFTEDFEGESFGVWYSLGKNLLLPSWLILDGKEKLAEE